MSRNRVRGGIGEGFGVIAMLFGIGGIGRRWIRSTIKTEEKEKEEE